MDIAVVAIYIIAMIAFGFWGKRRATTQSDDRVGAVRLVRLRAMIDLALHRVAPDLGVDGDVKTGQSGDELGEQRQRRDAAIGDDERPAHALRLQVIGDEAAGAGTEMDRRRKAEAMDHGGRR